MQAILINILLSEILQIPTNKVNYFPFNVPPSVLIIAPKHFVVFVLHTCPFFKSQNIFTLVVNVFSKK